MRVVTLAGSIERETLVAGQLTSDPGFDLAFRCLERAELLAAVRAGGLDAVVSVGVAPWFDFQCREEVVTAGVHLYGLAEDPVEADLLEVAGFTVVRELSEVTGLASFAVADREPSTVTAPGRTIGVWGPKGAPGRTTIAIELAYVLAQAEPSTLLVDADLYGGDITQLLGVAEELPGLVALCRMAARGEVREEGWLQHLRRVADGPVLLPGLLRAELWGEVSAFGWTQLLEGARGAFRTTVVDVGFCLERSRPAHEGPGRNEVAITALETADKVVAVVKADPTGIRSFLWSLADHADIVDRDRCVVVLNRVRPGEEAEVARFVRRHLGRPPLALIPDRPDHLVRAVWQAAPVMNTEPGSPISVAIRDLAADLGGEVAPRGFLSRLAGRRLHV